MQPDVRELCLELGRLKNGDSRSALLMQHPELLNARTVEGLAEAVRTTVRVDVPQAVALAEAALAIASEVKDDTALARAFRAKANAMWFMGDCKSATELFSRAVRLFEAAGKMDEVGRTLSSSIQSLALIGEYDAAFAAAAKAREIFLEIGETSRLARLGINVANLYHRQNRFAEALKAYERAYDELLPHKDTEGIGVALHNMAVCLIALDDFPGALRMYERVRNFCEQNDMPLLIAQADYNAAYLYYLRGDYTRALKLLSSAREACLRNGDAYHVGLCDLDQSEIYLELRLVSEAAEMAENSYRRFQQLSMNFESARALANLAIAMSLAGNFTRALGLFGEARELLQNENNQVWAYLLDLYRAVVLVEQNELDRAQEFGSLAEQFFRSARMPSKHVHCLLLLARISLRQGELGAAVGSCEKALEALETLDIPNLAHEARLLQGQIFEALSNPDAAYKSYQAARGALEVLRSSLVKEELKIGFMRKRTEVYARLTKLCLDRPDHVCSAEEAFSHVEAAKSRTLRDLIMGGPTSPQFEYQASQTDARAQELRAELNWYHNRLEREQLSRDGLSRDQRTKLNFEARQRERELANLLLEAPASASVGAALRNSSTAGLEEIRTSLGKERALVEYFELEGVIYAAVLTREALKFVRLAPAVEVLQSFRLLKFQLSKAHLNREYRQRFESSLLRSVHSHLETLYAKLIAPFENLLEVRDVVIVPYGPLHSLPFHGLYNGSSYLIDRVGICYAPSASIFASDLSGPSREESASLILGMSDSRTPFIREEVEAVAKVVPRSKVLFGPEATEEHLLKQGQHCRFIHIASHGHFRPDSPLFSAIQLGDGLLNLYDLYRMNLPVELLTLSGCVTGMNAVDDGDELLGLTRGLLYAGARSLLLSLWDVDDRSTADFMKHFYRELQTRKKINAFQVATRRVREQFPHPYHWASFKFLARAGSL
ncbi:MAG: CHAT domain-containing protein [Bryobacteraceae bacterium]